MKPFKVSPSAGRYSTYPARHIHTKITMYFVIRVVGLVRSIRKHQYCGENRVLLSYLGYNLWNIIFFDFGIIIVPCQVTENNNVK